MSVEAVPLCLNDFEPLARARLAPGAYAYYSGGASREQSLRENEVAFGRRTFRPRVLVDVTEIQQTTTVFGRTLAAPFGVAPTAQHGLAHPDGEAATARAAAAAGVVYCASTSSTLSCEEIARATSGPRWFQLYVQDGCGPLTEELLGRVVGAGYEALVLTVDLPVSGMRQRERRAGFLLDAQRFGNFPGATRAFHPTSAASYGAGASRASFTWRDLGWLRARCPLPIVLKGILTAEDARLACEHGADAIWVSNHGGRQLDASPAPVDVLEEVVQAVAGRVPVFLDGGVRWGSDVLMGLALGAQLVFLGRPILYALAWGGEPGVRRALELLHGELANAMALLGVSKISEIRRSHID